MSTSNRWTIGGIVIPRNPDDVQWPNAKANTYDETMLDGSFRRVTLPIKWAGRLFKLSWKYTDQRLRNALAAALVTSSKVTINLNDTQPLLQMLAFFDDATTDQFSSEVIDGRSGQGSIRRDLILEGRCDAHFRSQLFVPVASVSVASMTAWFGGATGVPAYDNLPVWNGVQYKQVASSTTGSFTVSNMGNAPWKPTIRINGPFSSFSLNVKYLDVDGTGQGVTFTWTGGALVTGSYLLFSVGTGQCWSVVGGVQTEVFSYTITTPGSSGNPYLYFPPAPVGNFTAFYTSAGGSASTSVDYSNNGTEQFRYFG